MKSGKIIKTYRQKKGMSQRELGKALGFSGGQYISNIERGMSELPHGKIRKCAELLGIDPAKMINIIAVETLKKLYRKINVRISSREITERTGLNHLLKDQLK